MMKDVFSKYSNLINFAVIVCGVVVQITIMRMTIEENKQDLEVFQTQQKENWMEQKDRDLTQDTRISKNENSIDMLKLGLSTISKQLDCIPKIDEKLNDVRNDVTETKTKVNFLTK